jgi:ESS family glutamate:Na+ symporter
MVEEAPRFEAAPVVEDEDAIAFEVLKNVVALLVALWLGNYLSQAITALGITLPLYIGAMIVATAMRNLDDLTGWLGLSPRILDTIGAVALSLFLVLALMTLRLWELSGLAAPLVVTLLAQVVLIVLVAGGVFRLMGRDYEAAVMTGGFIGFMLGTTANAMAVMRSLTERYGIAPRAFLVAPLVGAFFIDFANLLLITVSINLVK